MPHIVLVKGGPEIAIAFSQMARQGFDAGLSIPAWRVGSGHIAASINSKRQVVTMIKAEAEPDIPQTSLRLSQSQSQIWIDPVSHRVRLY